MARLTQGCEKEGIARFANVVTIELHPAETLREHHHLARIGRQHIVQLIVRAAPDIERVQVWRELGRRGYEFEKL